MPWSYVLSDVNWAIKSVLLVALMGAAIERVIRSEPPEDEVDEGEALIAIEALVEDTIPAQRVWHRSA